MHKNHQDPKELDLTKPRLASFKQKCKVHRDTVFWVDIQLAQRKGLKFYQTTSNAVILCDTLPACCISKAIVMKSEEIIYQKVYVSPRPPPKTSYKDNWMCDLNSDVAGSSKGTQRIQPKPKTQLSSTVRPVGGQESTMRCVLTPTHVENDQTDTGTPVTVDQKEEHNIDFRVPGLPHAVVKEAKSLWKRSKIIIIEQHVKPICSIIMSTIHPAKIRRGWSANCVMWSYSSCAKLCQKYNVPNVFFIGIKELCTALADNAWLTANPEESLTN